MAGAHQGFDLQRVYARRRQPTRRGKLTARLPGAAALPQAIPPLSRMRLGGFRPSRGGCDTLRALFVASSYTALVALEHRRPRAAHVFRAERVFDWPHSPPPDSILFSAMMHACADTGDLDRTLR